jgi:hypothetical protein
MRYKIFQTQQEAIAAEKLISQSMAYPKPGVNAETGEIQPDVLTIRWAEVEQIQDGRWVFISPDEEGEEAGEDWWPSIENFE